MASERPGVASPVGGRPRLEPVWSLWKDGKLARAETIQRPLGYEVRVYMNDSLLFSVVRPTRELVEIEAEELRQTGLASGWSDRPPTPGRE